MTRTAVADLLAAAGLSDEHGWITRNLAAALLFASYDIVTWEAEEWALESGVDDEALAWADPTSPRTPYAWLREEPRIGRGDQHLPGRHQLRPVLQPNGGGRVRHRGRGRQCPGLVTEVVLHGETTATHLIAAEAYSRDEWHLYDESIVVLTDPTATDALKWFPARRYW